MTITEIKNDNDPLLDALIDAYLINEQEIIKGFDKIESLVSKLREHGIKILNINHGGDAECLKADKKE